MELITFLAIVFGGGYGIVLVMMMWAEWYYEQEFSQDNKKTVITIFVAGLLLYILLRYNNIIF